MKVQYDAADENIKNRISAALGEGEYDIETLLESKTDRQMWFAENEDDPAVFAELYAIIKSIGNN